MLKNEALIKQNNSRTTDLGDINLSIQKFLDTDFANILVI